MRAYCEPGRHYPDEVIATLPDDLDPDGIGAIIYGDGTASNRWADGIVGLLPEQTEAAEADESPMCPDHYAEVAWS